MAKPINREQFIDKCLRELGAPVIKIHLDDSQVQDRVDEALQYYYDYHYDGQEKQYYKYAITQEDIDNKYITLPENIIGAVNIFDISSSSSQGYFSINYQLMQAHMFSIMGMDLVPYYMAMSNMSFIRDLLYGHKRVRYTRHTNRLYVDMDWSQMIVGEYVVVEAYAVIDGESFPDVWSDRWLAKYTVALLKRQQGTNLKKYDGMEMPGGIKYNGQRMYDEAESEIVMLEAEMLSKYSIPPLDFIG